MRHGKSAQATIIGTKHLRSNLECYFLSSVDQGEYFAVSGGLEKEEVRTLVRDSWLGILPFFMLFLLNNYVLVPYFLFKKNIGNIHFL